MALQRPLMDIPLEATAQLPYASAFKFDSSGRAVLTTAQTDVIIGSVVGNNGAAAPFQITARPCGIAQFLSDGTATITPGQRIIPSATVPGSVLADGSTLGTTNKKRSIGIAMNSVAAVAGLLVDVLIQPELIPST